MDKKTVIIGGVAGGATTAARLRRRDEEMEIILFEKGEYISYANCGLPYYIGDMIKSRDALLLQTPEAMKKKFNVDVRVSTEVIQILPKEKKVIAKNVKTGEVQEESYDNLVIATGSSPLVPPIPGIQGKNIFTLWTVPDTDRIKEFVNSKNPKTVAVIGGGFIGLEMAHNLKELGLKVSIIEMQRQVMAPIDYEMAQLLHENMDMNDVHLILEDGVKEFISKEETTTICLASGKTIDVDMVILSIGVRPNSSLAKEAGLELNKKGGIVVDQYLKTSQSDIYAVGDVIEVEQLAINVKAMIPLAGPANKQARILADNICGEQKTYRGSLGTSVAKVFDLDVAAVGINEKTLQEMGKEKHKDYETALIYQKSHAGYYPGATVLVLKLIFNQEGKIFGAQIIGQEGVDKRIDTIATTMRLGGDIYSLRELELAYAPPFSSAKDPVNMLGFVAENIIKGLVKFVDSDELDVILADNKKKDYIVLDVTEDMERMVYQIPNSYHIPFGQVRERISELDKSKFIITYCAIGVRSYNVARILTQNGFENVAVLSGGTSHYKSMHYRTKMDDTIVNGLNESKEEKNPGINIVDKQMKILDCSGMQCPGPIMKVNETIIGMREREILQVSATDLGFARDIDSWCKRTGNTLVKTERQGKENIVYIQKGTDHVAAVKGDIRELPQGKTMVVFSGDLDKILASFIIANGAAAMGRPVTMFFTFWGLNALRKSEKISVRKSFIEKMFGAMMPRGTKKLTLSNMNMAGMGTKMMKKVMADKNVETLEQLMKHAMDNGVKLIACTMSMDIMGIKKEELIDGVELAGVATYLGDAEESNVNLFI